MNQSVNLAAGRAPPQILVVDDAVVLRLYYRQILTGCGYGVAEAVNGVEALELALQTPFDLCVVDVNMPVMDGHTFVHALRANAATAAMPVLMISTQASAVDRQLAVEAGANFYLVKPVKEAQLVAAVAIMLDRVSPGHAGAGT